MDLNQKQQLLDTYSKGFDDGYNLVCHNIREYVRQNGNSFEVRKIDDYISNLIHVKEKQINGRNH